MTRLTGARGPGSRVGNRRALTAWFPRHSTPHRPSLAIARPSRRCRRTWTAILRPTTPVAQGRVEPQEVDSDSETPRPRAGGPDALRGLQDGDPDKAAHPEALSQEGGQDSSRRANLGEAGCQVIAVHVHVERRTIHLFTNL